ncbi:MAG: aminoacetone oxidase family FAD-binding enzyme [Atopobiaceae bacterium]|nr:aminoacetone oxidase family FAD-binding enzyme [Atopobiaceae bacterium]
MARKESRAQEKRRLLAAAASVRPPSDCDVIVVGGGAAGLVAAITAAEAGALTVVLERDLECGRRILATGNGRCNFANVSLDAQRYNDPAFVGSVCGQTWLGDVLSFFRTSGLRWRAEDGRLYPMSLQAASVRNVLLSRARRAGVVLAPAREVVGMSLVDTRMPHAQITGGSGGMRAEVACLEAFSDTRAFALPNAKAVVIASGGEGLPAAIDLGLHTAPRAPVLCPIACEDSPLRALDGRKADALVSLAKEGRTARGWRDRGTVLFRDYGISGVVVFDLSRRAEPGDLVELDLVPDLLEAELIRIVDPAASGSFASGVLDGVIDPVIAGVLERMAKERWQLPDMEGTTPTTDADALVSLVKRLPFRVMGPAEPQHAQVTRGGFKTDQFDPTTLASREHPWLFACGEALDVDADCGGFNLAWAWKSGMVAGSAAAWRALA